MRKVNTVNIILRNPDQTLSYGHAIVTVGEQAVHLAVQEDISIIVPLHRLVEITQVKTEVEDAP